MPLAITTHKASDLPLSVTLDDSKAMIPDLALSNFKQVNVTACLSQSGSAQLQNGDMLGEVKAVTLGDTIAVVINQIIGADGQPQAPTAQPTSAPAYPTHVTAKVSLSPTLQTQAAPSHTVFIYAKATNGPPMPLAVARKTVADLPLSVTLDDSMAMMPQLKLSTFQRVNLAARVSPAANAMPQSGDFIGEVTAVELANNPEVAIVIDRILP